MDRVISEQVVTATKTYLCDASEWWCSSGLSLDDCETEDQRIIVQAAEADNWRILRDQKYLKVVGVYDGEICTFRARIEMHAVCQALEVYTE